MSFADEKDHTVGAAAAIAASGPAVAGEPSRFDPDGDGTVVMADVVKGAGETFDVLDVNHDGLISARAGLAFRRADLDRNGTVTRDEFVTALKLSFEIMDADHDGQRTAAERETYRAAERARMRGNADR